MYKPQKEKSLHIGQLLQSLLLNGNIHLLLWSLLVQESTVGYTEYFLVSILNSNVFS